MTPAERPPRQRLDAQTRRSAILAAATRAFASQPYDKVSVARIAGEAGASEALVYRYFDTKTNLYAAAIQQVADQLAQRQSAAEAALFDRSPARQHVKARLEAFLDFLTDSEAANAAGLLINGHDVPAAREVRLRTRRTQIEQLRALLLPNQGARHEHALWGYLGFVEAVALRWVERGCPADERNPLLEAALGALEGALGDWGR